LSPCEGLGHTARATTLRDAGQARRRNEATCAAPTKHRGGVGRPSPHGGARHRAWDVQRHIIDDARAGPPPAFSGASQNLAAAAMLLRTMLEPSTTEGQRIQGELKDLLENATVRRAESSASRRRGCPSEHHAASSRRIREASVHTERTGDGTPAAPDRLGSEQHCHDRRAFL
jgi:hypothetical protein